MKLSKLFKSTTRVSTYDLHSGLASSIGGNPFMIMMLIKSHVNKDTGKCYPSIRRLMKLSGLAINTVKACIKTLEDDGIISRELIRFVDSNGDEYGREHYEYIVYR